MCNIDDSDEENQEPSQPKDQDRLSEACVQLTKRIAVLSAALSIVHGASPYFLQNLCLAHSADQLKDEDLSKTPDRTLNVNIHKVGTIAAYNVKNATKFHKKVQRKDIGSDIVFNLDVLNSG